MSNKPSTENMFAGMLRVQQRLAFLTKQGKCTTCKIAVSPETSNPAICFDDFTVQLLCEKCEKKFSEEVQKSGGGVAEISKKQ
jgi:hypothetical protein